MKGPVWFRQLRPAVRTPILAFGIICLVVVPTFVVVGLVSDDFGYAWNVVAGIEEPFDAKWPAFSVVLSVLGYLFMPVAIGIIVGVVIQERVRNSYITTEEARIRAKADLDAAREKN